MHKLLILYGRPTDAASFREYYVARHVPLAAKIPGLQNSHYFFDISTLGDEVCPYFCIFEAECNSEAALKAALNSPEGLAAAADTANFATGGLTLLVYPSLKN